MIRFVNMQIKVFKALKEIFCLSTKWKRTFYDRHIRSEISIQGLVVTKIISCTTSSYKLHDLMVLQTICCALMLSKRFIKRTPVSYLRHKHSSAKSKAGTRLALHRAHFASYYSHISCWQKAFWHIHIFWTVKLLSGRIHTDSWKEETAMLSVRDLSFYGRAFCRNQNKHSSANETFPARAEVNVPFVTYFRFL